MNTNNLPTYVFATVNPGRATQVVEELKRNSQIDFIAPVTGRYDLVLRLKPNTPEQVYIAIQQIRAVHDIRTTNTHTAFEGIQPTRKLESQMALGVSLLNVEHQPLESTIKQLSSIPGQFDIVALWQAKTTEQIMKTSVERLPNVGGLFKSETLLAYAPFFQA